MQEQLELDFGQPVSALVEWLRYIEVIFAQLTVNEAVDILLGLGFEHALFRADDNELYPLVSLQELEEIQDDDACQYPLYFVGGPPHPEDECHWYQGTLITWVVDALLHNLAATDGSQAMAIIQDVADIWDDDDESETRWELCSG